MKPIYFEKLVTKALEQKILDDQEYAYYVEEIKKDGAGILVQRLLNRLLFQAVRAINSASEEKALPQLTAFCNQLIETIATVQEDEDFKLEKLSDEKTKVAKAQYPKIDSGIQDIKATVQRQFPLTGLSQSVLFSGGKDNVSMESELRKEMLSADEVYWLVSFVKFEGIRLFESAFREMERMNVPVKIICTVYMGATDPKAIQFLSQFKNIQIKISYNTQQERLHAKSYIFKRKSDFNTAYIGSSNLSRSALTNGLEWNVKISSQEVPHIITKCLETFETYWNDKEFCTFNIEQDWDKLTNAIHRIKHPVRDTDQFFVDINPFSYQQEILEKIAYKRAQGQNSNLVVAATGTGKTVIAAFDFKSFLKTNPGASFLFVAHREEILKQAQFTFRQVLRNNDFGELFYGGNNPNNIHQLFATVQTMNSRLESLNISPTFYDYIIIDEVHHSAAKSYDKLLRYFTPKSLLGLTATPERADGEDITRFFANNISAEIRLPEALNLRLLCPFQYFGISDSVDLSRVSWRKGKYDTQALENVYTEDNRRVLEILRNCDKYLRSLDEVKAIGFCVSIKHAEFMQQQFDKKGIKAGVLTSAQASDRKHIIQDLRNGKINFLFVVDILNEGVDIPEVDTLLFLRPTESLTIFLQQLGRGLRIAEGKEYLTVLDFIGQSHAEYSFEHKFRGMLGKTHTKVKDEIENDFPHLPLGCSIVLEKSASEIILRNINKVSNGGYRNLLHKIQQFKQDYSVELNLKNFVEYSDTSLTNIYKHKLSFYEVVADALQSEMNKVDASKYGVLYDAMSSTWVSCDSPSYWHFILNSLDNHFENLQSTESQYLLMLYTDIFDKAPELPSYKDLQEFFKNYFSDTTVKNELQEYLKLRLVQSEVIEQDFDFGFDSVLKLHGRYTRNQILAGVEKSNLNKIFPSREGVLDLKEKSMELFFVTLDKTDWSNTNTAYQDYFINEELFHWESQNATSESSSKGQSYIHHKAQNKRLLLFIRECTRDENNNTMSYVFCGSLEYLSHTNNKPMSIHWRMEQRPPAALYSEGRKLAIG